MLGTGRGRVTAAEARGQWDYLQRETGLTVEKLREAQHILNENGALGPFTLLVTESQEATLLEAESRSGVVFPQREVIKWQRLT